MRGLEWPDERLRCARRDRAAYRRRSLARRVYPRFMRDLRIVPYLFLAPDALRAAALSCPAQSLLEALKGRAIWTLDTAVRLAGLRGFLVASDLTGYLDDGALDAVRSAGLIDEPAPASISVDPLLPRPPLLVARLGAEPPFVTLLHGQRIVTWERLIRDIMGTIGWRPDLLSRIEDAYRAATE